MFARRQITENAKQSEFLAKSSKGSLVGRETAIFMALL